jgi:hypothetical protein
MNRRGKKNKRNCMVGVNCEIRKKRKFSHWKSSAPGKKTKGNKTGVRKGKGKATEER